MESDAGVRSQKEQTEKRVIYADGPYASYMEALEKTDAEILIKGKKGKWVKARGYHLSDVELEEKLAQWHRTGVFPSPYTKGIQTDLLTALALLGPNKAHPMFAIKGEMKRIMSVDHPNRRLTRIRKGITDWERFAEKPNKSEKGKNVSGRLYWTATALRRVDPKASKYPTGYKLAQMGACIEVFRIGLSRKSVERVFLRLNTHSTKPVNKLLSSEEEIPPVDFSKPSLGPPEKSKLRAVARA